MAANLHPLHALYLRRGQGEAATLPLRAQHAQVRATGGPEGATIVPGSSFPALGIGAAVAAVVARLVGAR